MLYCNTIWEVDIMLVCHMRLRVKSVYSSRTWETKVNKMSDQQVIAVYYNMVRQGKIK